MYNRPNVCMFSYKSLYNQEWSGNVFKVKKSFLSVHINENIFHSKVKQL